MAGLNIARGFFVEEIRSTILLAFIDGFKEASTLRRNASVLMNASRRT